MDANTGGSLPSVLNLLNKSNDVPNTVKFATGLGPITVDKALPVVQKSLVMDGLSGRSSPMQLVGPGKLIAPLVAIEINSGFGAEITGMEITGFATAVKATSILDSTGLKLTNNLFHGNLADVIRSTAAGKHQITNNQIYSNIGTAIYLEFSAATAQQSTINGNQIGVSGGNGGDGLYLGANLSKIDVHNNLFVDNGAPGGDAIAISASAGSNIRVSTNTFEGNGGSPIDLKDDGPTANDASDLDAGPNNILNYPVIDVRSIKREGANWAITLSLEANKGQDANDDFRFEVYRYDPGTAGYWFLGHATSSLTSEGKTGSTGVKVLAPFGDDPDELYSGDRIVALAMNDESVAASYTSELGQAVSVLPAIASLEIKSSLGGPAHMFGISVVGTREQLRTVPIGAADTVVIGFNQPVTIVPANVSIKGGKGSGTTYGIVDYDYDPDAYTFTVQFDNDANSATPLIVRDQLVIKVEDDVVDVLGNKLDGEWMNPTSVDPSVTQPALHGFNSGNGVAGGDFEFHVTLLPGDPNRTNKVDLHDFGIVQANFGSSGASATWANGNCDGQPDIDGKTDVDLTDFGNLKANMGVDYITW